MKNIIVGLAVISSIIFGVWFLVFCVLYPLKYEDEIILMADKYNIDSALVASIINAESSFDKNKVSPKGAVGLMQIMPSTAFYISPTSDNLFDTKTNIEIGVKYLSYLIQKFNDIDTALFAYNAGEGNVSKWLNEQSITKLTTCPFPETNAYVDKINSSIRFYELRI